MVLFLRKRQLLFCFFFAIINKIHIYNVKRDPICCLFATKSLLLRDRNENKGQRVRGEEKKL
jgi:hypothetical protein